MKLYKTVAHAAREDGQAPFAVWSGSQADAGKERKRFTGEGIKRADIATEEVDVPTNKAGLLEWLNANAV